MTEMDQIDGQNEKRLLSIHFLLNGQIIEMNESTEHM